jgi:hypothetical protein
VIKKMPFCILTSVFCLVSSVFAEEINQPSKYSHTHSETGFIKAISWGWPGEHGTYSGPNAVDSMKKMTETRANWICISFAGEMMKPNEPNIFWADDDPCMVTDAEIRRAIDLARKNNLKVILKPVVNVRDGTWRGYIDFKTPNNKPDVNEWNKWFADFDKFLLHYAKIAQETKCEMFCLGCEMSTTEKFMSNWRGVVADVRKVYTGAITYNANHGNEEKVKWWDAVDVIGMSGYYPVGADMNKPTDDPCKVPNDSSVEGMKKRWKPIKQKLKYVSQQANRPVFFIEIGVCSAKGNTSIPWQHPDKSAFYDADEQARFYQAVFETFWDEPWFFGFAWWDWPANLYSQEDAKTDSGFCIYGKPAEKVVKEWYSKPR